ncbi:hypothetical protein HIM_05905 [Hirsutella minnesotensis 3608]|uniref:Glutamine amidotransferase type-2 domain-containing protein n=1 Tax=Hirsutella minnesotensis 3608 TaxID=1043627 RepID=A0A0F7ZUF8_9HYPO|nr:hypothetical protein HIM_05905 [Hirsutella minnesotensis 3608]
MCGISVIVALEEARHVSQRTKHVNGDARRESERALGESLEMIAHRGPDSRGTWISDDGRIALGHCRLAINDLTSDGHQPMHDEEGIHVVVNGEIYDYDGIRQVLTRDFGHEFQGHSDSELVLALYKYHGTSFLEHIRGEFALCLYDSRSRFFMAARDRYGIKPLFWTVVEGRLLIAAEAKAFLPLGWKPQWDLRGLVDDDWQFGGRTLFRGVQKVRPGQYLMCNAFGPIECREYWDIEYPDKAEAARRVQFMVDDRSEEAMIRGVREKLIEAIRRRLRADVPVGIYLSGGIDSSAVAGIVAHLVRERGEKMGSKEEIACFSIGFDEDSGFDESDVAGRTASWLGVDHHKLMMGEEQIAADLEEATWHCEHHNMNLNFVGKFALSRLPRKLGYPVVLTGEGADEQFAGYPVFVPDMLAERDWSRPATVMDEGKRQRLRDEEEQKLTATLRAKGAAHFSLRQTPAVTARELHGLVTASALTAAYQVPLTVWAQGIEPPPSPLGALTNDLSCRVKHRLRHSWHPLHSGLYVWTKSHLANSILSCLGDRTEMAHSIEARTPFLDHGFTEYVNRLPPSVKLRYDEARSLFVDKWVLREAIRPFITPEVYDRRKHAYTAPVIYPARGPLHRLYRRLLTRDNVDALGFLDWGAVQSLPEQAFGLGDVTAFRTLNLCCQWIILAQRFGIAKAEW